MGNLYECPLNHCRCTADIIPSSYPPQPPQSTRAGFTRSREGIESRERQQKLVCIATAVQYTDFWCQATCEMGVCPQEGCQCVMANMKDLQNFLPTPTKAIISTTTKTTTKAPLLTTRKTIESQQK